MNKFWAWVFLVAAGALTLLFFSNDFGLIDIQKTAIVAAIGIDTSEETEGQWSVTAQIAVPDANAGKASNISIPSAETMGAGIAEVNRKTGWYPTLVHCRLILLGEKVAEDDVFRVLGVLSAQRVRGGFLPGRRLRRARAGHAWRRLARGRADRARDRESALLRGAEDGARLRDEPARLRQRLLRARKERVPALSLPAARGKERERRRGQLVRRRGRLGRFGERLGRRSGRRRQKRGRFRRVADDALLRGTARGGPRGGGDARLQSRRDLDGFLLSARWRRRRTGSAQRSA